MLGLSSSDIVESIDNIIQEAGYEYAEQSLGKTYSAFSAYLENEHYGIIFNTDHYWNERFRRFTIAHELGHINMPHHAAILKSERQHKSRPEFQSNDPLEREADLFAINFLIPREAFEKRVEFKEFNRDTITELANAFNVSVIATAFRFIELTDLVCALVVSDQTGKIKYEKRSREFSDIIKHGYLKDYLVSGKTQTYDMINSISARDFSDCDIYLNEWYPNLYNRIPCTESVLNLGYNNTYITLLSVTDLEED